MNVKETKFIVVFALCKCCNTTNDYCTEENRNEMVLVFQAKGIFFKQSFKVSKPKCNLTLEEKSSKNYLEVYTKWMKGVPKTLKSNQAFTPSYFSKQKN